MIFTLLVSSFLMVIALQLWQRFIEYFPANKTRLYRPSAGYILKTIAWNFFRPEKTEESDRPSRIKVALLAGFKKFFLSFFVVALFFAGLELWLERTGYSDLSQKTILEIEETIRLLTETLDAPWIKWITFFSEVAVTAALIALASAWPIVEKAKLKERFSGLMNVFGILVGLLTLAASFTFYGNLIKDKEEEVKGNLRLHELKIIEGNKLALRKVQQTVERIVAEELLNDDATVAVLNAKEANDKYLDSLLNSPDYNFFKENSQGSSGILQLLQAARLQSDIIAVSGNFEQRFTKAYQINSDPSLRSANKYPPGTPAEGAAENSFYDHVREAQYEKFSEANLIKERELSEEMVEKTAATFSKAEAATTEAASPLYAKYGDVIEKNLQKSYEVVIKDPANSAFKSIWSSIPFFGELLEPVHEVIQQYIVEKTLAIINASSKGEEQQVADGLAGIKAELKRVMEKDGSRRQSLAKLRENLRSVKTRIEGYQARIRDENRLVQERAAEHLRELKSNSRWQQLREGFKEKAVRESSSIIPSDPFSKEQWSEFAATLNDWENYMNENKVTWFVKKEQDLERLFYNYLKENPKTCGAWGFILQQDDWYGAVEFYTRIQPDAAATGKPYYLLKYYCVKARVGNIDELYTSDVDSKGVEFFCPR